jgi:hypothetical protein
MQIDANIPAGNIIVDGVDGDTVRLRQDIRDTEGWWFYWAFRVRGAGGKTLQFQFTDKDPLGVRGPAVSTDEGTTWRWLGRERQDAPVFSYAFPSHAEVRFSFGIPYLQSDWDRFLRRHFGNRRVRPATLCVSRHGRQVECATIGTTGGTPSKRVLVTARHHCCEAMANFELEGMLDAVLAANAEETRWLADSVEFFVVPFVDKDGSEEGDQGKNRKPRDHGRDYVGESLYPETAAIRRAIPAWSEGKLDAAIDLHCPWIRGKHNEDIYIVGSASPSIWEQQQRFGAILEGVCRGPLPYRSADNLPFGQDWNVERNYAGGRSMARWAGQELHAPITLSIELPYANVHGAEVTPDRARAFGADLARALGRFLH